MKREISLDKSEGVDNQASRFQADSARNQM